MSGQHVFCDIRWYDSSERGIDGACRVPLSSAVVCIESIPAYVGVVVPGLPFLMYVWLSCRAVVLAISWMMKGVGGCCCALTILPAQPVPLRGYCERQRGMLSVCSGVLSSGRAFLSVVGRICY